MVDILPGFFSDRLLKVWMDYSHYSIDNHSRAAG